MRYIIAVLGFILVLIVMWDAFETIISPRRITSRFRFARFFYRVTWWSRSDVAQRIKDEKRRETYLSMFGPLSLLVLLSVWAMGLVATWEEFLTSIKHSTRPHEPELMAAGQETYRAELKVVQPHF